jgi:hypothetical protein
MPNQTLQQTGGAFGSSRVQAPPAPPAAERGVRPLNGLIETVKGKAARPNWSLKLTLGRAPWRGGGLVEAQLNS